MGWLERGMTLIWIKGGILSERWRTLGCMALLALLPVSVLYVGRPGDDAMFHMSSWMEMATGWRAGVVLPAWATGANFGLGEPRFMFYPPLTIVLGAALRMVLPAVAVPGVMVWLVLMVSGWAMLALAGEVLPAEDRGRAAMLYVTSYYLLIVALLRFAIGELMAAALLPWVVLYFLRAMRSRNEWRGVVRDMAGLAVALAGMWLSDVPASLAAFYALAAAALVECVRRREAKPLLMLVAAETLAVGLSGCYLVPAMLERGKIGATNLLNHSVVEFMLWHQPLKGLTPAMTYPLWGWVLAGAAVAMMLGVRARVKPGTTEAVEREVHRGQMWVLGLIAGAALLFQVPPSLPLWRTLPQMGFVQFPYRFDGVLGCVLPVMCLLMVRGRGGRRWMYAAWGMFFVFVLGTKVMQQRTGRGGTTFAGMVQQVGLGYGGCPEFTTKGMPLAGNHGAEWIGSLGACVSTVRVWAPERRVFTSAGSEECAYRVGLRFYPDWRLWVDGREDAGIAAAADGLTTVTVPAGTHVVELRYVRPVWMEAVGAGVSGVALLAVTGVWFADRRRVAPSVVRARVEVMA